MVFKNHSHLNLNYSKILIGALGTIVQCKITSELKLSNFKEFFSRTVSLSQNLRQNFENSLKQIYVTSWLMW